MARMVLLTNFENTGHPRTQLNNCFCMYYHHNHTQDHSFAHMESLSQLFDWSLCNIGNKMEMLLPKGQLSEEFAYLKGSSITSTFQVGIR